MFDNSIAKELLDYIVMKLNLDEDNNLIPGGRHHNFKDFIDDMPENIRDAGPVI